MKKKNLFFFLPLVLIFEVAKTQIDWRTKISFEPFAIFNNNISELTIKVDAREQNLTTLSINLKSNENITFLSSEFENYQTSFPLFDDGTHGDEIANDNIFSIGGIRSDYAIIDPKGYIQLWTELIVDSTFTTIYYPYFFVTQQENFSISVIENNILFSEYAVCFFQMADREDVTNIINKFYTKFSDSYDFILLYQEKTEGWHGSYLGIKNDVEGIGLSLFDFANQYGSSGRLEGILLFGTNDVQLVADLNSTVMHEFAHRWGAYLSDPSLQLSDGSHWNNNTTIIGMLNNCCFPFIHNSNGSFTHYCSFQFNRFAPLELYLMGALSKEELDTSEIFILNGSDIETTLNDHIPCNSVIVPDNFFKVTSENIVNVYGEREPSYSNSQKNFRTATILVTEKQPTEEEMCLWNKILRHYSALYDESDLDGITWGVPSFANYSRGRLSNDFLIELPTIFNNIFSNNKIAFYPNPINTSGTFSYSANDIVQIKIYNASGTLLEIIFDNEQDGETHVDLSNWNPGLYIYQIIGSNGIIYSGKITKE